MKSDPVLALKDSLLALAAERSRLAAVNDGQGGSTAARQTNDDDFAAFSAAWHPVMRRLADTPATTLEGVALKLRVLAESMIDGRDNTYSENILLLAIADLARLSQEQEHVARGQVTVPAR